MFVPTFDDDIGILVYYGLDFAEIVCFYSLLLSKNKLCAVPFELSHTAITLYDQIWQAGVILLSTVRSVGVMGDERTYEHPWLSVPSPRRMR